MSKSAARKVERKAPAQRRLKLVDAQQKKTRRRLPWLVILSLVFVFTVIFGVLIARVVLVKTSFKLQKLQTDLTAAEELHEELILEAAKMESPARIEREARAMGMVDPPTVNYIVADIPRSSQDRFASVGEIAPPVDTGSSVSALGEESP